MNKSPLLTVVLALSLASAFGQEAPQRPQINISGSADVKVAPDEANIRVGVETRDSNLDEARRQHDERMKNTLKFLKSSGIPSKDIQTDFFSVEPEYNNNSWQSSKAPVYIVRKSIEIRLTNVTNLESVLTGLLSNGVNQVHNVEFRTTQLRKYRDQAREMAVKAAKEKADALCSALGVKRGKPLNINANEYGGGWSRGYNYSMNNTSQNAVQNMEGGSDSAGDTLSLGQISVSASVNISFAIE